tara:strand:+ start:364 stop:534 length:171 start_codon:yes stop_codon:yes gene_type:complete
MAQLEAMLPGWLALAALACFCLAPFQSVDGGLVFGLIGGGLAFLAGVAIGGRGGAA